MFQFNDRTKQHIESLSIECVQHRKVRKMKTKTSNSQCLLLAKKSLFQVLSLSLHSQWHGAQFACLKCWTKLNSTERINFCLEREMDTERNKIAANEQIKQVENAIRIIVYDSILFILFFDYVRHKLIKISYDHSVSSQFFLLFLFRLRIALYLYLPLRRKMPGIQNSWWIVYKSE